MSGRRQEEILLRKKSEFFVVVVVVVVTERVFRPRPRERPRGEDEKTRKHATCTVVRDVKRPVRVDVQLFRVLRRRTADKAPHLDGDLFFAS